ncbi:hypothetical protein ACQP1P_28245 [Dactylosporangium sp. CA-052675]|uniref:hypothetical protein n=1 Tax=Dactylosporangium sp. CA-052675 TaxID=3239927 RepID=UPI003D8EABD0
MSDLSRRTVLVSALAAGLAAPFAAGRAGAATAERTTAPRLVLPRPTGPYPVGTVALHLRDRSRERELMASAWYPARDPDRHPRAIWLADAPMRALLDNAGFPPGAVGAPITSGHDRPQVARAVGMSDAELRGWIGTLDPGRAVRIQQVYPLAFFDQHLRGRHQRLLDGPSRAFSEVRHLP